MPEHSLEPGQEVISALVELGEALDYTVEREYAIPNGTGTIDVAWLRRPGDRVPLVALEVESRAGQGLASNAMKILGRSATEMRKPLHLFHVVVRGGMRSDRPVDVQREFSGQNYSVHLLSDPNEPRDLFEDVLTVHRRLADRVNGVALGVALVRPPWPVELLDDFLHAAEDLGFSGLSERAYLILARRSQAFVPSLARRLVSLWRYELAGPAAPPDRYVEPAQTREEPYGSYLAWAACEAVELAMLAALLSEHGPRAFEVLREWQELNHIGDRPGPFTGAGGEWTEYCVSNLGFMWGLIAALMEDIPGARAWCAAQPAALLEEVYGGDALAIPLLAVWVMHIAAGVPGCEQMYERARARVEVSGGVTIRALAAPESAAPGLDGDSDYAFADIDDRLAPGAVELVALVREHGAAPGEPRTLAIDALLEDPGHRPADGGKLAAFLARQI